MIRSARTKIASKVAKIESSDDFHYAKWLRAPKISAPPVEVLYFYQVLDGYEIEQLKVPNSLKLKFRLPLDEELPSLKQKYKIEKPKSYLVFFGLTRPQLFYSKENLLSAPSITDYKSHLQAKPKIIDQSPIFIAKSSETINQSSHFIVKQAETIDQTEIFLIKASDSIDLSRNFLIAIGNLYQQNFVIPGSLVYDISFNIVLPEITDHLANLIPSVYNIELLNAEQFKTDSIDSNSYNIESFKNPSIEKIKVPGIDDLINTTIATEYIPIDEMAQANVIFYTPTFEIAHPVFKVKIDMPKTVVKKVVVKQKNLEPTIIDILNDTNFSESSKLNIKSLLSSFRELTWEDYSKTIDTLDSYKSAGAEFLASNSFALLSDELGYDKFDQTASAISYLFKKSALKSILIISESNRITEYWEPVFKKIAKEIRAKRIEPGNTKKIKSNMLWFLNVDDIGKLEVKDFEKLDMIVFDELINIKSAAPQIDKIVEKVEPHFIWFLTAVNNEKHNKNLLENFEFTKQVEFNSFGNKLSQIFNEDHPVITKDVWLDLDEMQKFEYAEAIAVAKEELEMLFDSANPLRFQSNIFTIIHKLKQILNFSSFRNISPKANIMLEQVDAIARNKKKAVVFTQYDVNGMKKIEKALEANDVKFVIGKNGMSTEELKKTLNNFYERDDIPIFLTNLKASRLRINLNKVPYIINFDQWWNPATLWQNTDDLGLNDDLVNPVVVYNYYIKNTFEADTQRVLEEKGFDIRYLFENLKSETISEMITPEDWLAIFGLNSNYKKQINSERAKILSKLQTIDLNSYKALMKYFFSYLGYKDITVMDIDDEPMFYLIGSAKKGSTSVNLHSKCLLTTNLKKEDYEEVIHFKPAANEIKRKFIITNGEFAERVTNGTMYIDGKELANFILTLGLKNQLIKRK